MLSDVMDYQFWRNMKNSIARDEQICSAGRTIKLAQFALMQAHKDHWLKRDRHEIDEAIIESSLHCASGEDRVSLQPADRENSISVFSAKVCAVRKICKSGHNRNKLECADPKWNVVCPDGLFQF